eukprot:TRINITY_DN55438_c0_g1_i1.p1 TRINITY_DN55438_c0_g1~~TRINITY_DN55438_c0_g1_i1.p1  ORF type:complete len:438 (+),score=64.15 TRINITY_DN55438_c0_g1_i1:67-1380(+)
MNPSCEESRRMFDRAQKCIAGGVNSKYRAFDKPHPLFFTRGQGSQVVDADDNVYVDYVMGRGPLIFGHSPSFLLEAVNRSMAEGMLFGAQHWLEVELAEAVQRLVPCADVVRFANSGTEAVQLALRIARGFTGRSLILRFEGHYHGWSDSILFEPASRETGVAVAGSEGTPPGMAQDVLVLPWNDLESVTSTFERKGVDIAAVITEPIMCNTNCIMPKAGYLEGLRQLCSSSGALLVFDEVITGFRLHPGGAQTKFGVTPDLGIFAKAMAGGFPMAMVAGRREMMARVASGAVVHAGTYNGNVLSVAAALATVKRLSDIGDDTIAKMHRTGQRLITGLRDLEQRHGLGLLVQGPGPVFAISFSHGEAVTDYLSHVTHTDNVLLEHFVAGMLTRGFRMQSGGCCFVSSAHTDDDVDATLRSADAVMLQMRGHLIRSQL